MMEPQNAQPAVNAEGQPGAQPAQGGTSNADPGMAEQHKAIMVAAMKALYAKPETAEQVVGMVQQAEDPASGIAQATALILEHMRSMVKGIDPKSVYVAAAVLAASIAELAMKAGVIPEDWKIVDQALAIMKGGGQQRPQQPAGQEPAAPPVEGEQAGGIVNQAMAEA